MRHRLHKLLLILVALSVTFAPLRGAWALPNTGPADSESHCAGMQHDMQQMKQHANAGDTSESKDQKCKSGCNGSCCKQGCNACLHVTAMIPASLVVLHDTPAHEPDFHLSDSFPERHLKPPLRPPLALHR